MLKIKGIKKAIREYKQLNKGGIFSPWYGELMYNRETHEAWTDSFYSIGHNSWKVYHDDAIINLGNLMVRQDIPITELNVMRFVGSEV